MIKKYLPMTAGRIALSNGTLYGVLKRMEEDRVITSYFAEEKRYYALAELGTKILDQERKRITELYHCLTADDLGGKNHELPHYSGQKKNN